NSEALSFIKSIYSGATDTSREPPTSSVSASFPSLVSVLSVSAPPSPPPHAAKSSVVDAVTIPNPIFFQFITLIIYFLLYSLVLSYSLFHIYSFIATDIVKFIISFYLYFYHMLSFFYFH